MRVFLNHLTNQPVEEAQNKEFESSCFWAVALLRGLGRCYQFLVPIPCDMNLTITFIF